MARAMETVQLVDDVGAALGTSANPLASAPAAISAAYASSTASLSTTAAQVVAAGALPNLRILKNTDATNTAYIGGPGVTVANGFPLKPGESVTFDAKVSSAALFGICGAGTPALAVLGF